MNKRCSVHSLWIYPVNTRMDTTSRKLVRRARMRRNHERQARAAATKSKRKSLLQQESTQWELPEWQDESCSTSTQATRYSNVPNLPALADSQYMICTTNGDTSSSQYGTGTSCGVGGPPDKVMKVATPFPGRDKLHQGERAGKQRRSRHRKVVESAPECMSDTNVPTTQHWKESGFEQSGNFSDSAAVLCQQRAQGQQEASRRVHRRREGRRRTVKQNHGNSSKIIETVLEENIGQNVNPKITTETTKAVRKILPQIPSNPPSPTLSRMVQRKTEKMNISDNLLEEIKEMSSHLRIVNWLWDSNCMPLHKTRARPSGAVSPSTTNSSNLVVVRGASESNWFDMPRLVRQEQLSPISMNSELKSDVEDELMHLL